MGSWGQLGAWAVTALSRTAVPLPQPPAQGAGLQAAEAAHTLTQLRLYFRPSLVLSTVQQTELQQRKRSRASPAALPLTAGPAPAPRESPSWAETAGPGRSPGHCPPAGMVMSAGLDLGCRVCPHGQGGSVCLQSASPSPSPPWSCDPFLGSPASIHVLPWLPRRPALHAGDPELPA